VQAAEPNEELDDARQLHLPRPVLDHDAPGQARGFDARDSGLFAKPLHDVRRDLGQDANVSARTRSLPGK